MIEFNPDGSLKIPGQLAKSIEENNARMKSQRCIRIKKEIVSFKSPKKCVLHIILSDAITDDKFIEAVYKQSKETAQTPIKLTKINNKEYAVEIGTDFRRCSDCTSLMNRYREFLSDNLIEEKGSCTYERYSRPFSEEDYFE